MNVLTLNVKRFFSSEVGQALFKIARSYPPIDEMVRDLEFSASLTLDKDLERIMASMGPGDHIVVSALGDLDGMLLMELIEGHVEELEEDFHEDHEILTDGETIACAVLDDEVILGGTYEAMIALLNAEDGTESEDEALATVATHLERLRDDVAEADLTLSLSDSEALPDSAPTASLGDFKSLDVRLDLSKGIDVNARIELRDEESAERLREFLNSTQTMLRGHAAVKTLGLSDLVEALQVHADEGVTRITLKLSEHRTWLLLNVGDIAKRLYDRFN